MSKFERLCHRNTGGHSNDQDGTLHVWANTVKGRNKDLRNTDQGLIITSSQGPNNTPAQGLDIDIDRNKANIWVRNLSKTPLTNTQEKVLARGPSFTIVPKVPPVVEYVVAIEKACQQLKQGEAEELRGEIKSIIKKIHLQT